MIEVYQAYIAELLKRAGIKTKICVEMRELQSFANPHVGAAIVDKDTVEKVRQKKVYTDEEKMKKRVKRFNRETIINVVIGENNSEMCDKIFAEFLSIIDDGLYDNAGNYIPIEVGEAEWVTDKDSILKSKIAVEIPVTFYGGVYREYDFKQINWSGDGEYVKSI